MNFSAGGPFGAPAEYACSYFGARYLASDVGRFTTVDPVYAWKENLVDPQRWNRYAYVRNNPLRYLDPDGRYGIDVHVWLTWGLAHAAGYDNGRAVAIAWADGNVDIKHNPLNPLVGDQAVSNRARWHFASEDLLEQVRGWLSGPLDDTTFGENLHVVQDHYSHGEYGPEMGHFPSHDPDSTANHPDVALKMATETYRILAHNPKATLPAGVKEYVDRFIAARSDSQKEQIMKQMVVFVHSNTETKPDDHK